MTKNYYEILGVGVNASKDEIKKAYRSLQMKFHPDKNPGNQEAMLMTQKINEAYETLSDEEKKQEYDMMRNNPFMRMDNAGGVNMDDMPLNDIFSMMFGGGHPFGMPPGMPHGMPPGTKIHVFHGNPMMNMHQALSKPMPIIKTLELSMEQVFNGGAIPLEIERWIIENGNKVHEKETIYIDIPQGIDENEMIILRDKGNVVNEQVKGDLKINIKIQNNTSFKRSGLDIILEKTISLKESLCGFSFDIKHINGKSYTINNNKGNIVPPEYNKIYQGMGMKRGEHKGNMIIHFHVEFPEKLTEEQISSLSSVL